MFKPLGKNRADRKCSKKVRDVIFNCFLIVTPILKKLLTVVLSDKISLETEDFCKSDQDGSE